MANYLKSPAGKDRQALILCGSGHCSYGMGTASRLQDRLPDAKMRILIMSESGDVKLSKAMMKHAEVSKSPTSNYATLSSIPWEIT